jgi:prolyl-tRNA synthetase
MHSACWVSRGEAICSLPNRAMKASQFLISTLKEAPADAEVVSHKLMMRAGMIKKLGSGIYSLMPMGLRVVRKVETIVREEMNRAGAVELSMPVVQPAELWQETGRFEKMGPELLRIKDRHERDFVVQPTSEEVVTDIARQEIKSYKQLPKNLYQIQTKFRDERRPRFGLMRGREFIMKDAYSFDRDQASAKASYQVMAQAYRKIFDRFGLRYRAVAADSGAIGGDLSEEFQVIAATGEDAIVYCPDSEYAANLEKAEALAPAGSRKAPTQAMTKVATPGKSTCADVAKLLGVPLASTVKSLVLATDATDDKGNVTKTQVWLLLLRGDHDMNEVKVGKLEGLADFRFATEAEIKQYFVSRPGYLGPVNRHNKEHFFQAAPEEDINIYVNQKPWRQRDTDRSVIRGEWGDAVRVVADREVAAMSDFICGANDSGFHYTGVNWGRDLPEPDQVADIRNLVAGDASPDGKGVLAIERGIEVGHVFYLGTKYSRAMNATFLDVNGKPQFMEMGCYGIGITRLPAAAVEQNHDDKGIIWPDALAPFTVVLCPISPDRFPEVQAVADALYADLLASGVDVILDDRGERPGAMFADWELIGVPHCVKIGDRGLKEGMVEYQHRRDPTATSVPVADVAQLIRSRLKV